MGDTSDVTVAGEESGLVCRVAGGRATLSVRVGPGASVDLFDGGGRGPERVEVGDVTAEAAGEAVRLRRDAFGSEEALVAPSPEAARAALAEGPAVDRTYLPTGTTERVESEDGLGDVVGVPPGGVERVDLDERGLSGATNDRAGGHRGR